jgi:hypothetical protein
MLHEVLTAVNINITILGGGVIAPCSPYVNGCFGGTYHLHLHGVKINGYRNQRAAGGFRI